MKGLIRASLGNPYAVIVMSLAMAILGGISLSLVRAVAKADTFEQQQKAAQRAKSA